MRGFVLPLLGAILIALAVVVWRARRDHPVNKRFTAFTLALAAWTVGIGGLSFGTGLEFWGRFTFAAASLMPATFLAFARVYPVEKEWPPSPVAKILITAGVALAALGLTTPWLVHDVVLTPAGLNRRPGPLYPIFAVYFLTTWLTAFAVFSLQWREARGRARAQLHYLGTGLAIATVGGITTNLIVPWLSGRSTYSSFGPVFVLPLAVLLGHAIIRLRLLDLRVTLGRSVLFGLVLILLTSASVGALWLLGILSGAPEESSTGAMLLVAAGVVAICASAPIAPRVAKLLDAYLLRGRPDLDAAAHDAARRFARQLTPSEVLAELQRILDDAVAPEWIMLAWRDPDTAAPGGATAGPDHMDAPDLRDAAWELCSGAPRIRVLAGRTPGDAGFSNGEAIVQRAGAEVWLGLGLASDQLAVLLLGPRRNGEAYLSPVFAFLEQIGDLASMALETAYLHHRRIRLEREQQHLAHLTSLTRSFAGFAHEIRTPLTTLSNLLSVLPERVEDAEYRDLLVRLVPAEISRIVNMSERLRALSPEGPRSNGEVNLVELVADIVALLRPNAASRDVSLTFEPPVGELFVYGERDGLIQIIQNLIMNAIEACPPGGHVITTVGIRNQIPTLQVLDDGSGLASGIAERLFEPFSTTKAQGRGLGLSICREIAQAHGASLTLENRRNSPGAMATLVFPPQPADR